jgi:ubiquinone/menaquinone biosynthesis C-methylase UbiE
VTGDAEASRARDANRRVYDALAGGYDRADGRRTPALAAWLRARLREVRDRAPGGRLLDLGCGTGFLSSCAEGAFDFRAGVEVSPGVLDASRGRFDEVRVGDAESIPYPDGSFDAVAMFAVLHHLARDAAWVREVRRVLVPGGVLYTDHDMDLAFRRRFAPLLAVYRRLRAPGEPYGAHGLTEDDRRAAEAREDGVDGDALARTLADAGFRVAASRHWYGLNPVADRVFGTRPWPRGLAPLLRVIATAPPLT